jgi:hypothetical protein
VGNVVADGVGDPRAGLAHAALVAGRAEVAGFAGEGEELLVPALRAMEAGEAGGVSRRGQSTNLDRNGRWCSDCGRASCF